MAEAAAAQGYPTVSVADVIERAGMSRRTFYEVFPNREECFLAAYEVARRQLVRELARGCARAGSNWHDQVSGAIGAVMDNLAANPAFASVLVVQALAAGPRAMERHRATMRLLASKLRESHPEPGSWAPYDCVAGGLQTIVHSHVVQGRTHELPTIAPELVDLVILLDPAAARL